MVNQFVKFELIDVTRIELTKAVADMFKEQPKLLSGDELMSRASDGIGVAFAGRSCHEANSTFSTSG